MAKSWKSIFCSAALASAIAVAGGINPSGALEDGVAILPASLDVSGADLAVSQTRDDDCRPGRDCTYKITVTNKGPQPYAGTLNLLGASSVEPRSHELSDAEGVTCSHRRWSVACRIADLRLNAGQSTELTLALRLPRTASGEMRTCSLLTFSGAELDDPLQDLVTIVQLALQQRGYYKGGEIDGTSGRGLRKEISAYRAEAKLDEGEIDAALLLALFGTQGLMPNDPNKENDMVCETFELPKFAISDAQTRLNRRRAALRRARLQRRNVQAQPSSQRRNYNIRLDGLDPQN